MRRKQNLDKTGIYGRRHDDDNATYLYYFYDIKYVCICVCAYFKTRIEKSHFDKTLSLVYNMTRRKEKEKEWVLSQNNRLSDQA